jgi:hypothetical protein
MTEGPVENALAAAGRYLLAGQAADGAWRDFSTEPGVADAWTTAYVGLCLLTLSECLQPAQWKPSLVRAATWLRGRMDRFSGWGYNSECPPDADSSAHAILFLRHCGVDVPLQAYARLLAFGRPDGGFATYLMPGSGEDSWGVSHPCVTPVVVHALLTCLPAEDPRIAPSLQYIRAGQTASGLWPSFWWGSPLYGTAVSLEAAVELELDFDRAALVAGLRASPPVTTAFELALLVRCLTLLGLGTEAGGAADSLLRLQEADGGWPASPILRVTRRSCFAPWQESDPGPLHADEARLFTTATALRGLAEWRHRGERSPDEAA